MSGEVREAHFPEEGHPPGAGPSARPSRMLFVVASGHLRCGERAVGSGCSCCVGPDPVGEGRVIVALIARELKGQFPNGNSAHLIHVDAYRLGGNAYAPGQNAVEHLLDELE